VVSVDEIEGHPVADESAFVSVLRDDVRTMLSYVRNNIKPMRQEDHDRLSEAVRRVEIALMSPYRDGRIPVITFSRGPHDDLFGEFPCHPEGESAESA
jgi:hypothetical protein